MTNATAGVFLGTTVQVSVEVSELPRRDQLSLLHNLMERTGTTAAIHRVAGPDAGFPCMDEISEAITEAWKSFAEGV